MAIVSPSTRYKAWSARCVIDGQPYDVIGLPTVSRGLDQARSTCAVELRTMPPADVSGKPAYTEVTCNGTRRRFFTGYVAPDTSSVAPLAKTVNLVDVFYKLVRTPAECGLSMSL